MTFRERLGWVGGYQATPLWSPEGKNFTASDLSYLSLTFAMARQWRIDRQEKRALGVRPKKSNLVSFIRPKKGGKIFFG